MISDTPITAASPPQSATGAAPPQPPVTKKEIFGWCMYDVADSAFTTIIVTTFYAQYFSAVVVGEAGRADLLWGVSAAVSEVVVGLLAPILGAIADFSGSRKKFLGACAMMIVFFTASLYFVGPGMTALGVALYVIANIGFAAGGVFIDSFLPGISNEENAGRISGRKWAMGYISGLVSLILCLPLSANIVANPTPQQLSMARLIPVVVAVYYAIAVIPTFLFLRERSVKVPLPPGENYVSVGFRQVKTTFAHIKQYRDLFRLLIAFLIYNDGIVTVIYFAGLYAKNTLKFTAFDFGVMLIVINVVAATGAFVFGFVADRIGQKRTIFISLSVWLIAVVLAYLTESKAGFYVVAGLVGIGMGSCQSVSRSLVALFTPKQNAAEFFGFLGVAGKSLAFAGPLIFGLLSWLTGSQRPAILSVGAFFIIGMILLWPVNEARGKAAAGIPVGAKS
jgi:UMF1 family MFS transporter